MRQDIPHLEAAVAPVLAAAGIEFSRLIPHPGNGVSHRHFRVEGTRWLVRAPRLSQLDLEPSAQLALQQASEALLAVG